MDLVFAQQVDVLDAAIIPDEVLDVVFLDSLSLLGDALVRVGELRTEEALPLIVGEGKLIKLLELSAQVSDEIALCGDVQVLIGQGLELLDERTLELRLALIAGFTQCHRLWNVLTDHSALVALGDEGVGEVGGHG